MSHKIISRNVDESVISASVCCSLAGRVPRLFPQSLRLFPQPRPLPPRHHQRTTMNASYR